MSNIYIYLIVLLTCIAITAVLFYYLAKLTIKKTCAGKLYLDGENLYMQLTEADQIKIAQSDFVIFEIHRKNIKGLNE